MTLDPKTLKQIEDAAQRMVPKVYIASLVGMNATQFNKAMKKDTQLAQAFYGGRAKRHGATQSMFDDLMRTTLDDGVKLKGLIYELDKHEACEEESSDDAVDEANYNITVNVGKKRSGKPKAKSKKNEDTKSIL